jgi:beta-galactosidase
MGRWTRREVLKSGLASAASLSALQKATASAESLGPSGVEPGQASQSAPTNLTASEDSNGSGRERLLLDFGWRFQFGQASDPSKGFGYDGQGPFAKTGGMLRPSRPHFDDSNWRAVDLPHD